MFIPSHLPAVNHSRLYFFLRSSDFLFRLSIFGLGTADDSASRPCLHMLPISRILYFTARNKSNASTLR
jgi:hypothetical protein